MNEDRLSVDNAILLKSLLLLVGPVLSLNLASFFANPGYVEILSLALFIFWLPFGLGFPDLLLQGQYDKFLTLNGHQGALKNKFLFYKVLLLSKYWYLVLCIIFGVAISFMFFSTTLQNGAEVVF